jgi:hypothetical protein
MRFPRCYPVFRPLNRSREADKPQGKPRGQLFWGRGYYLAALIPIPRSYFWFKRTDLLREVRELFGSKRRDHPAAEQRDERASPHSITSSARASSCAGTVSPSIVAVWALMISSNLVDCTTGKSAGLAPLRMRPA